jgi:RNA polymerase sigma-70 factor (ECF subfamily)
MKIPVDIDGVKKGNPEAFRAFFDFYYPKLMALACRFVDQYTAEDMVQEVFAVYWEQKQSIEAENILSYLFKSVQNKCLNFLKHQLVVEEYEALAYMAEARIAFLNHTTDTNDVFRQVVSQDIRGIVDNSVNKLPPKCAEAFRLCYYEDLPHKEIAERMGISHRTVESHVRQAIAFLREDLRNFF